MLTNIANPATIAAHAHVPACTISTKLEKDTVYMPSNVAARVLGQASEGAPGAVNVQLEGVQG